MPSNQNNLTKSSIYIQYMNIYKLDLALIHQVAQSAGGVEYTDCTSAEG